MTCLVTTVLATGLLSALCLVARIPAPPYGVTYESDPIGFQVPGHDDSNYVAIPTKSNSAFDRIDIIDLSTFDQGAVQMIRLQGQSKLPSWVRLPSSSTCEVWSATQICGWPYGVLIVHAWPKCGATMFCGRQCPASSCTAEGLPVNILLDLRYSLSTQLLGDQQLSFRGAAVHMPGFIANSAINSSAILGLLVAWRQVRRAWRLRRNLCARCGYPRGHGARCSECGDDLSPAN
jgi:hypothetical protein